MGQLLTKVHFTIRHKAGIQNKVADALSRKSSFLTEMRVEIAGFDTFKELYLDDKFFGPIFQAILQDGFLFKGLQLCIPECSLREKIVAEKHSLGYFWARQNYFINRKQVLLAKIKKGRH